MTERVKKRKRKCIVFCLFLYNEKFSMERTNNFPLITILNEHIYLSLVKKFNTFFYYDPRSRFLDKSLIQWN